MVRSFWSRGVRLFQRCYPMAEFGVGGGPGGGGGDS